SQVTPLTPQTACGNSACGCPTLLSRSLRKRVGPLTSDQKKSPPQAKLERGTLKDRGDCDGTCPKLGMQSVRRTPDSSPVFQRRVRYERVESRPVEPALSAVEGDA